MREPLISLVSRSLARENVSFAVVGAAALAVHGYARATSDLDLLTTDSRVLRLDWSTVLPEPVHADVRIGDADDPLAGVITFDAKGADEVDLIIGRWRWQTAAVQRARASQVRGVELPVVGLSDLVVLKLDAGGILDLRDIDSLVEIHGESLLEAVRQSLPDVTAVRTRFEEYVRSRRR